MNDTLTNDLISATRRLRNEFKRIGNRDTLTPVERERLAEMIRNQNDVRDICLANLEGEDTE
jgi:hypothetical protein